MIEQLNTKITENDLQDVLNKYLKTFNPFFLSVSGAHIYGFASKNSDIDIRGAYLVDAEKIYKFWSKQNNCVTSENEVINEVEIDFVCHEINKYIDMIIKGNNGYVLEQIFSPIILRQTEDFVEFKETVQKYYITKKLFKHYSSFAYNKLEEFKESEEKRVKTLLYGLRVIHTGIHLFNTGEIVTNLPQLNQELFNLSYIDDLIEQKQLENSVLENNDQIEFYTNQLHELLRELEGAYNNSSLPENVRNKYKLSKYVANLYSKHVLKREFTLPVMRSVDDKNFIDKSKEKLLLENSPFSPLEKELDLQIYPQINIFVPDLDRYFIVKDMTHRGQYYEFIDIEAFLRQLNKSSPFSLLLLANTEESQMNKYLVDLKNQLGKLLTTKLYKSFKNVANKYQAKLKLAPNFEYDNRQVILMLAMLIYGAHALKQGDFNANFDSYIPVLKAIKNRELSKKQILAIYEDLLDELEEANNNTNLPDQDPDKEVVLQVLEKIKKKHWLNED
jgi:predicted nucleotidyltransferase